MQSKLAKWPLRYATLEWRAGCAERCKSGSGRRGWEIVRLRPVSHSTSHGRTLVVPVHRAGFVFRPGRGLVDESTARSPVGCPSRTDGLVAATRTDPSHSALGSGCQFTSEEYQRFLAAHHVICSMSAVGNCADNVAAESFFGVLKRERVNRQHYRTRAEARADIFDYIERSHNPRQRRRLDMQQQAEQLLTQPSVITG